MSCWYPIHTKPRQEKIAQDNLLRQDYEVYLPQIQVKKFTRRKWQEKIEPLFPRYLFVHLDLEQTNTAPIRSTIGVSEMVRFGSKAVPVTDDIIEYLKAAADPITGVYSSTDPAIKPGENIMVMAGPLHGIEGVFDSENGDDRVMILINVLGRLNRVQVDRQHIAPSEN